MRHLQEESWSTKIGNLSAASAGPLLACQVLATPVTTWQRTELSGTCPTGLVDQVGYYSSANCFEGFGGLLPEISENACADMLTVATFNVENLDALDPQEKFDRLAAAIPFPKAAIIPCSAGSSRRSEAARSSATGRPRRSMPSRSPSSTWIPAPG